MPLHAQLDFLTIRLDETGTKVIAARASAGVAAQFTVDDLKAAVEAAGFGAYTLSESALRNASSRYNAGERFELEIGKAVAGVFNIDVDADHLQAYLTYTRPSRIAPVTFESVLLAAKSKKVNIELNREAVESVLKAGGERVLIASGKAAVPGVDGRLDNLVPTAKERTRRLNQQGLADFPELGEILFVHAGDPLIRRVCATAGEPGLNLSGQTIPAKPGKEVMFEAQLAGTRVDPSDPNLLIAAIDGYPVVHRDGISVEPVYRVENVDLRTGNIDFAGMVEVSGEIQPGMTIKASGDIHIKSTIEGVTLIAEGDIVVDGGIIGLPEAAGAKAANAAITCKKSCNANFAQNARITAGGGIFIRDFAMQSELSAGHQVLIGASSRNGHLIGGTTRAAMLIKAQVIGSPVRAKTVVIAAADPSLHNRLKALSLARESAANRLVGLVKVLRLAEAHPDRVPAETTKVAHATVDALNLELAAIALDEEELKTEIALCDAAQVIAEKQFLEGVEVVIGVKRHRMVADMDGGFFQLKEGELARF
jgi:uncharacterized protein